MTNEINPEAVAAAVATDLTKEALKEISKGLTAKTKDIFDRFFPRFEDHLSRMYARNSKVKIITSKETPIPFDDIYVSSNFEIGGEPHSDRQVLELVEDNKRAVVSANGGAGKTFLMRFLWLEFFKAKKRIPIFVELRTLNKLSNVELSSFIRSSAFGADRFSAGAFSNFCEKGVFVFILDGFDEVNREKRHDLESQILNFSKEYSSCGIIVSGRPDDRFDGWQGFCTVRAVPFDFQKFS